MGLRINSNIAALTSYNALNKTDKAVSSSLEKLSSGFRINKAADDAAGLVVSEGLKSQIGGLTVAARNAQDGVNVAQTADGALSTQTDILQRMRDLAVQASNGGTQDTTARNAANTEFQQLSSELTRIAGSTAFGGQQLLDGTYNGSFQIGANNNALTDRIAINLTGNSAFLAPGASASAGSAGLAANTPTTGTFAAGTALGKAVTVTMNGVTTSVSLTSEPAAVGDIVTQLNANTSFSQYYTASTASGQLVVTANAPGAGTITLGGAALTAVGLSSGTAVNGVDPVSATPSGFSASGLGVSGASLDTVAHAQSAITALDNAIKGVSTARATIGAVQNRFEKTIDNLNTAIQNITASNSAIRDTDMAAEMTKFTKNQVLAQAGTSMLAQANSSTQNILTLLRG